VAAFEVVAGALIMHMLDTGMLDPFRDYYAVADLAGTPKFLEFTDGLFWTRVRDMLDTPGPPGLWARALYYRIRPRMLTVEERFLEPGEEAALVSMKTDCSDNEFRQRTVLKIADLDGSFDAAVWGQGEEPKLAGDIARAIRVVDPDPEKCCLAQCLAKRESSPTRQLADKVWERTAVYRMELEIDAAEAEVAGASDRDDAVHDD
jgi:hypothetical protein